MSEEEFFEFRRKVIEFLVVNAMGNNAALTDNDVIRTIRKTMSRN